MPKTRQQIASDLQRNILSAIKLSRGRQPNPRFRSFIFNEPGDFNQQQTPVVEVPGANRNIGIDLPQGDPGFNIQQLINTVIQRINKQKQFRLQMNLMNMFKNRPMMRGQAGPVQFGAGPFVGSSQGRPNVGFGVQGRVNF